MAQIAIDAGFEYGAQLPGTIYFRPYFVDQDWKKPNKEAYIKSLQLHKPYMASVMDWETSEQFPTVIEWAEEAAKYVEVVIIIPKVPGEIYRIPREIGGKQVRLGFSVPTKYGGTDLYLAEFAGWPVHLLGGSPARQMELVHYLDVKSADGNMAKKMAHRNMFWTRSPKGKNQWNTIKQSDGVNWGGGNPNFEAFRRSCKNVMAAWGDVYNTTAQRPGAR